MIAMAVQPAVAQTVDAGASSQSVSQTQVLVGSGGGGGTLKYDGSYTVRNVPDAIAPMIAGGANPCVVGMSAAGSVVGFGMSAGGSWSDPDCERRNLSIILMNASAQFDDPALAMAGIEVLCQHDDVANAMAAVGRACATRQQRPQQVQQNFRPQTASAGGSDFDWINDPQIGR